MFRNNITLMPLKRIGKVAVALELKECGYNSRLTYTENQGKKEILLDGSPINITAECWAFSFHYKVEVSNKAFGEAVEYLATPAPKLEVDPASWDYDITLPFFEGVEIDSTPISSESEQLEVEEDTKVEVKKETVEEVAELSPYSYEIPEELIEIEEEILDPDYWLSEEHKEEFRTKSQEFKLKVWDVYDERYEARKKAKAAKQDFIDRANSILDEDDEEEESNKPIYDSYYNQVFISDGY